MAERPVFFPEYEDHSLVDERLFNFQWASGFAEVQKKKNIKSLHEEAKRHGVRDILEISSKSDIEIGKRLSAFSLKISIDGKKFPLESVYQGCKVFENSGNFPEIFEYEPREAKRFVRQFSNENIIAFELQNSTYPTSPKNAFYDWLYIKCLASEKCSNFIQKNVPHKAFTDIEFNPRKQINCQARAFAEYISLLEKGILKKASEDFSYFSSLLREV